jgi:hypothetical protein
VATSNAGSSNANLRAQRTPGRRRPAGNRVLRPTAERIASPVKLKINETCTGT